MKITSVEGKHGLFKVYSEDAYVARSLIVYGDYAEDEVVMATRCMKPGAIAVEVGANIGALTVPIAKYAGKVYAFEAQPENRKLLSSNIAANELDAKVRIVGAAVGNRSGKITVPSLDALGHTNFGAVELDQSNRGQKSVEDIVTLDQFFLNSPEKIAFIKIDVEGMERDVLEGGAGLIARDQPIIYVENDREAKSAELIGWLIDHGYRCYWHRVPLFYKQNHRGFPMDVFGNVFAINMLCVPESAGHQITGLEEVADHRVDALLYEREYFRTVKQLERKPDDVDLRCKAAHFANLDGRRDVAKQLVAAGLDDHPENVNLRAMQGLFALQDGDYITGWPAYELRYQQPGRAKFGFREHGCPHWDGSPTKEVVKIWGEQGFGDTIMFIRFVREALARAPNAIVEVQPQLFELIELSDLVPMGQLFRYGRDMPKATKHCSIPSLPATLGLVHEAELHSPPYLAADHAMFMSWVNRSEPRLGVCLRGGVASERAYSRDMPAEVFEPIAREFGPFMSLEQHGQWESYADTAAAIAALDHVFTVDTSVAHLAGALGVPTTLMLSTDPDWRWQLGRSDSPWYPHMRILRQTTFMDWSPVIEGVRDRLNALKVRAA